MNKFTLLFNSIFHSRKRRIIGGGVVILAIIIGYHYWGNSVPTKYVLAQVTRGQLINSVTGSGQISSSQQVDIKPKVSGTVTYVASGLEGKTVGAGTLLVQMDAGDALKAVRDAQINLQSAQISLQKLQLSQNSNPIKLQDNVTNAQTALEQSYTNSFTAVSNAFLDFPSMLTRMHDVLYARTVGGSGQDNVDVYQELMDQYEISNFIVQEHRIIDEYNAIVVAYNKNSNDYKAISANADPATMKQLLVQTSQTATMFQQAIKDQQNLLDTLVLSMKQYQQNRSIPSAIISYQSAIAADIGKINGDVSSLANAKNTITNNEQSLASAQRDLANAKTTDPLDLATQLNTVQQRQSALDDARSNLANYSVRAPFAGIVAKINVHRGDSAGGAVVATMIAPQQIAEIPLNEVDAATVKVGQKATFELSALADLALTGTVSSIDAIGTVTQGVVNYNAKIALDTQDARIRPGMSVTAHIITAIKQDVLLVPNGAIKSQAGSRGVDVIKDAIANDQLQTANTLGIVLSQTPTRTQVQTGSSDETMTEITEGLQEGDTVVVRTVTASATKTTAPTTQTNRFLGGGAGSARTGATGR